MANDRSAQPCGCDEGADWLCEQHRFPSPEQVSDGYVYEKQAAPVANRKQFPVATGFLDYFPKAVRAVANVSYVGNEQHHPGKPLHWDRSKSADEADALMRHFQERGTIDTDGTRHSAKVAWRAMALLEKELEQEK